MQWGLSLKNSNATLERRSEDSENAILTEPNVMEKDEPEASCDGQ